MKIKILILSLVTIFSVPLFAYRINEGLFEELKNEFRRAKANGDFETARRIIQEMEEQGAEDWETQGFRSELNCTTYKPEPCYGAYPRRMCPGDC